MISYAAHSQEKNHRPFRNVLFISIYKCPSPLSAAKLSGASLEQCVRASSYVRLDSFRKNIIGARLPGRASAARIGPAAGNGIGKRVERSKRWVVPRLWLRRLQCLLLGSQHSTELRACERMHLNRTPPGYATYRQLPSSRCGGEPSKRKQELWDHVKGATRGT